MHSIFGMEARTGSRIRRTVYVLSALAGLLLCPGGQLLAQRTQPQSLGDLPAKGEQQRDAATPRSKVYTNDDLKRGEGKTEPALSKGTDESVAAAAAAPTERSREDIVRTVTPAVVTIEASGSVGTGFFVAPGVVLTNKHVVGASSSIRVRFQNGETSLATVTTTAADADLALVRISNPPGKQPLLVLGSVNGVQVGSEVLAIGSALGLLQSTVTRGIVSAVRSVGGLMYVQTDAAINPGNSGGPLLDTYGRVIGITTSKVAPAESLGFAIAMDHAKKLIQGQTVVAGAIPRASDRDARLEGAVNPALRSDTDLARERGAERFEVAVQILAQRADGVDTQWQRYRLACGAQSASGASDGRDWFGIWTESTSVRDPGSACGGFRTDLVSVAAGIRLAMQQAEENARRAGVYPGVVREIRKKYLMYWSGSDR
jgi:S1-C subfamily serine protease